MREFQREAHRLIGRVLDVLNGKFLHSAHCYFGGGTQLALTYGEYRESKDIDFLCASREGFREIRQTVTQDSLGKVLRRRTPLAREVRADRDGVRTFLLVDDVRIKFEIVLEARIDLNGEVDPALGVPVLDADCAVAEMFLANADRGVDESTLGRDLIDLAFLAAHLGKKGLAAGLSTAEEAYGTAVRRSLSDSLEGLQRNRARTAGWLNALKVSDLETLRKGLRILRALSS